MATSNIRIAGATYPDVPSVTLKDTSNNDVSFVLTSDATASADKIEQGYTAYVNGQKITGTSSGGGGTDTSQANATAGSIRVGSSAYVNGELIQGAYEPMLFEGRVSSSTVAQTISASDAVTDYTPEEIISVSGTMTLSGSRFVYNLGQWTTSMEEYWTYSVSVNMEIGEQYYEFNSIFEYSTDAMPIKCDLVTYSGHEEGGEWVSEIIHLYAYITDTQIYIEADDPTATVSFNLYIGTPEIDGLYSVTIDPYTLQSKTATPTTSSQTITADTGYDGLSQVTVNAIPSNYVDTSSATATATDILSGATAFVNGNLVTGSLVVNSYYTGSGAPSSSLGNDGDIYFDIS